LEGVETQICTTIQAAVAAAYQDAEAGDTVLLAPAAASFDQYDSFEKRGDDFAEQVQSVLKDA
jgi:UDP-N-acetylmuramoylalanine--D-glutamate ligase